MTPPRHPRRARARGKKPAEALTWTGFAVVYGERALRLVVDGEGTHELRIEPCYRVARVRISEVMSATPRKGRKTK